MQIRTPRMRGSAELTQLGTWMEKHQAGAAQLRRKRSPLTGAGHPLSFWWATFRNS